MQGLAKACVGLAIVGFLGAVVINLFTGPIMGVGAEAASRAANNLALIALCLFIGFKDEGAAGA